MSSVSVMNMKSLGSSLLIRRCCLKSLAKCKPVRVMTCCCCSAGLMTCNGRCGVLLAILKSGFVFCVVCDYLSRMRSCVRFQQQLSTKQQLLMLLLLLLLMLLLLLLCLHIRNSQLLFSRKIRS